MMDDSSDIRRETETTSRGKRESVEVEVRVDDVAHAGSNQERFNATVKTILQRVKALEDIFPDMTGFDNLNDLESFEGLGSLTAVRKKIGQNTAAAQIFDKIMLPYEAQLLGAESLNKRKKTSSESVEDVHLSAAFIERIMKDLEQKNVPKEWVEVVKHSLQSPPDVSLPGVADRATRSVIIRPQRASPQGDQSNSNTKDPKRATLEKAVYKAIDGADNGNLTADSHRQSLEETLKEAELEFEEIRGDAVCDLKIAAVSLISEQVDQRVLRECLCESAIKSTESNNPLQNWHRLAKRACQIAGLFVHIRENRKEKTEQSYYAEMVTGLGAKAFSYSHALKYDRLGRFLLECPNFLFQRKFVTLGDWFQFFDAKRTLIDGLLELKGIAASSVFMRDRFQLHHHGFQIFFGALAGFVGKELIEYCAGQFDGSNKSAHTIFNNKRDDDWENDKLRWQVNVNYLSKTEGYAQFLSFKDELSRQLQERFPSHKQDSCVILLSHPNCKEQLPHTDYGEYTLRGLLQSGDDTRLPLACLVALQDGTAFNVWPFAIKFDFTRNASKKYQPIQVVLNAGDMLIFRGDLVHAGAATKTRNVRIHMYMDVEGIERPKVNGDKDADTTFLANKKNILKRK